MKRALSLVLGLTMVVGLTGCPHGSTGRHNKNGGPTNNQPPPPTAPTNPNPAPGTPDPTNDNTAFVQAVLQTGTNDMVVYTVSLIGSSYDSNNPGANGTLPPPKYRFRGSFSYNKADGTRISVPVDLELSTGTPTTLSASSSAKQIHPTNPDIRFTFGVVNVAAPNPGPISETLLNNVSITATTANVGNSLGFSNPSTPPLP